MINTKSKRGKLYINSEDFELQVKPKFNIGVICDNDWDNYFIMNKYFKKIDDDYFKLHTIYFKNFSTIIKSNNNCFTTIITHCGNDLIKLIFNLMQFIDFWIIFSDNIDDIFTPVKLVLEKCISLNYNYIVISSDNKINFNLNNQLKDFENLNKITFKKLLKFIIINNINFVNNLISFNDFTKDINIQYNTLFLEKFIPELILTSQTLKKLKVSYAKIESSKHQIKLLYDKDEAKKEKAVKKIHKQNSYLQFTENRHKFISSFKNQ